MNKIQIFILGGVAFAIGCMILLSFFANSTIHTKNNELYPSKIETGFFLDMDSNRIERGIISTGRKCIVVLFDSECIGCRQELALLDKNIELLAKGNFLLISKEEIKKIKYFSQQYHFNEYENFHFVKINGNDFDRLYKKEIYPTLLVYDETGLLIKSITGTTDIETLLKYLEE